MATTVVQESECGNGYQRQVPPLENGDHLSGSEFLRRFEAMPEVKKAELIQGIAFMASPVRATVHGQPDGIIQMWLGVFAAGRTGVGHTVNSTLRLGPDDVPQPDAMLFMDSVQGGRASLSDDGYLCGAPELIVEIAASSVSKDAREKFVSYRRGGVQEYLLWRVEDEVIEWWSLEDDEYVPLPEVDGIIESRVFPGLRLDVPAALRGDRSAVLAALDEQ
jgi:hypothetical protein